MLDAYIIDRIRRERERREGERLPLRIEVPKVPPGPQEDREKQEEDPDRGSVDIDFRF